MAWSTYNSEVCRVASSLIVLSRAGQRLLAQKVYNSSTYEFTGLSSGVYTFTVYVSHTNDVTIRDPLDYMRVRIMGVKGK